MMGAWISANAGNIICILLLIALVVFALRGWLRGKKDSRGCCGSCSACGMCKAACMVNKKKEVGK